MDAPGRFDLVSIMHDHPGCDGFGSNGFRCRFGKDSIGHT